MESTILAILGGLGGAGGFAGLALLFNSWRESRRNDKKQDAELAQIAAKFNLDVTSSATTLFSNIADRLQKQLDHADVENEKLKGRIAILEDKNHKSDIARQERDKQILDLKNGQEKMSGEMETLRKDNAQKDEEITHLKDENVRLNARVKVLEEALKAGGVPIPNGENHE